MPIKTVIFDFDGVFVRAETFSARLEKDHGISRDLLAPFFRGIFQKCLVGEADLKREITFFYRDWGWKGTLEALIYYWFMAEGDMDDRLKEVVKKLKDKKISCYLATNQEKYRAEYLKKNLGLEKVFDRVFVSSDLGCKKPEQVFYEKVFMSISASLPVKKKEIIFIDDDPKNIEGAMKFGFQTFLYRDFENFNININNKLKINL